GVGGFLAPPLVTSILLAHGWRASFYICAVIGLVAGAIWFMIARDAPRTQAAQPQIPWRAIAPDRNVALLTASYFCYGYAASIFFTWFFIYLNKVRGLDLKSSAIYGALPFLAMAIGSALGGVLSDAIARRSSQRLGRCGVAALGIAVAACCIGAGTQV